MSRHVMSCHVTSRHVTPYQAMQGNARQGKTMQCNGHPGLNMFTSGDRVYTLRPRYKRVDN
eukprot:13781226-Heterocapsa_arctica.AAC.1